MKHLLEDIEQFKAVTGLSDSGLGLKALNDPPFVSQIRNGREILPRTEKKVRDFMTQYLSKQ